MTTVSGPRTALVKTLVDEHSHIKAALSILQVMQKYLTSRRAVPPADLTTIVRFFSEYADKIHHHGEEEQLFPAVQQTSNRQLKQMLGKLGTQHLMGRLFVGGMKDALKDARAGRRGWRKNFLGNARAYHTLLSIHICDEDNLFFPMAEKALSRHTAGAKSRLVPQAADRKIWEGRVKRLGRKYCPASSDQCCSGPATGCCDSRNRP